MYSSTAAVFLICNLFSTMSAVSAGNLFSSAVQISGGGGRQTSAKNAAAIYFMTNDPTGNSVVSCALNSDGTIDQSKVSIIPTGGKGLAGLNQNGTASAILDPLFSQDSVIVHKGLVMAVNAGSNSISTFSIDQSNPQQLELINQVSSQGDFPMALTAKKGIACVANGGQINGIACFSINASTGLSPIPNSFRPLNLNLTSPPRGPLGTVSDLVLTEDASSLFVSVKGNPPLNITGFIATYAMSLQGLPSTQAALLNPQGSVAPFSITLVPGSSSSLFFTDAGVGVGLVSGNTSQMVPIQGQGATCWSDYSSRTNSFYVTDIKTSVLSVVSLADNGKVEIVKQHALEGNTMDLRIAALERGDFIYINEPGRKSVQALELGSGSAVKSVDVVRFGEGVSSLMQGMAVFDGR